MKNNDASMYANQKAVIRHNFSSGGTGTEVFEYDENGYLKRRYDMDSKEEQLYKYDKAGNLIYHKNEEGKEEIHTYDVNGNETYYKGFNGLEASAVYNKDGNLLKREWNDGKDEVCKYDELGRQIYETDGYWDCTTTYAIKPFSFDKGVK